MSQLPLSPSLNCDLCPRLAAFRSQNRQTLPNKFNAPVPSFGDLSASVLIIGLAPGLKGANSTGRPFTGDYAGDLLYATLLKFGLATGTYQRHAHDSLVLQNCRITNALRCVPPQNKPTGAEIKKCLPFLQSEIAKMGNLRTILVLGAVAHSTLLSALSLCKKDFPFSHGALQILPNQKRLLSSYHCSRYNTNTSRLTIEMFEDVFRQI